MDYLNMEESSCHDVDTVLMNLKVNPFRLDDVAFSIRSVPNKNIRKVKNYDLIHALGKGKTNLFNKVFVTVSLLPFTGGTSCCRRSMTVTTLLRILPYAVLASAILSSFFADAKGSEAVFPSFQTVGVAFKLFTWILMITVVLFQTMSLASSSELKKNECDENGLMTLEVEIEFGERSKSSAHVDVESLPSSPMDPLHLNTVEKAPSTPKNDLKKSLPEESEDIVPFRFIRATKGDLDAARIRWKNTLVWRQQMNMNKILHEPHPTIRVIKDNYPHYFHLRGRKNECCYYESPPKMNLKVLKDAGLTIDDLLRHYALCTEYMWKEIEPSEEGRSIYVIDLAGIGIFDFVGEVVDFVKRAAAFTAEHYPERSGNIFVINVPQWFSVIWNAVRPFVDEVTQKKITILKWGPEAITKALEEKIPIENIPPEYGGKSMPLGFSPEEEKFRKHFQQLNESHIT